ncbi:hypothetical protein Gxy13693_040_008 [Komagataeibacter xylinus NBRC 13693]|uniref:Outer membrane protein n=1 Tax=Komagataeibacter xylinus NBRC 13693 TaxID=1234668 RepID=A0A0D6QAS1_KOMXY|nr:hypothetical protein [Komagataeibacter xylinus]GAO00061.1 hypothetical protein Gxy13693_040_008 [Komagataeibacter xylinus NBRC 13693]
MEGVTNGLSVTVGAGATIATTSNAATNPSTTDNDAIVVRTNSSIEVAGTVETQSNNIVGKGGTIPGLNTTDTIEGENGTMITVDFGGQVFSAGTQKTAEAINLTGEGNTIINNGTIEAQNADAMYFDDEKTSVGTAITTATIINNGTIAGYLADNTAANPNGNASTVAIGEGGGETFNITNESGATIEGEIVLNKGVTNLTVDPGSTITGSVHADGVASTNTVILGGDSSSAGIMSSSLQGVVDGFSTLDKTGTSTWEADKSINSELINSKGGAEVVAIDVKDGTLALTGNGSIADSRGVTVNSGGTCDISGTTSGTSVQPLAGTGDVALGARP